MNGQVGVRTIESTRIEYVIIDDIVWYGAISKAFAGEDVILLRIVNAEFVKRLSELNGSLG
jgi:hypothetical protein